MITMAADDFSADLAQIIQGIFEPIRAPSLKRRGDFEHLCHYTSAGAFADIMARRGNLALQCRDDER